MQALPVTQPTRDEQNLFVVKFADAAIPEFKEVRSKDYILYGEDNSYPDYLIYLFNKSAKHNAILNGKALYIFGQGFNNGDFIVNRLGESLNDIAKKCALDLVLFGGFKLEIIWNFNRQLAEIYYATYSSLRKGKDGGFYYAETWGYRNDPTFIPAFNPAEPYGTQIFEYNEYRPGSTYYPLPDYIGCNNYIETDIEISKFYLSAITNGMMPSKYIQFFTGNPTEDKKADIEKRFKKKFSGSENSGSIILEFLSDPSRATQITDLSDTNLDKMFIELNKTVQQEIFSGHLVTSPMLFGIKTEGQLGGTTELRTSYSLFQNTYAKPKADAISGEFDYLLSYSIWPGSYELQATEPVQQEIDIKDVLDMIPQTYIFKQLGIPEDEWPAQAKQPAAPVNTTVTNEAIRNLTGRQQQQLERIIRKYKKRQLDEATAKTLLRTGLGLSEEDINSILGIKTLMSKHLTEDEEIHIFDQYGEPKEDYEIIHSKKVAFDVNEIEADEKEFIKAGFVADLTQTESKIIGLIKKDPLITPEVIATTIGQTVELVKNKLKSLQQRGLIEAVEKEIGADVLKSWFIPEKIVLPKTEIKDQPLSKISIRYSYEGPQDSRNRPFCAKLLQLSRLYSRADIEKMSARLGYSVWDRRGGFWRHPDGEITPYCRHRWKSNIVILK